MHYLEPDELNPKLDVLGNVIIDDFRGPYFFLSNFYLREIVFRGVTFPSTEHAYMWCKTIVPEEQAAILECATPGDVKRYCDTKDNITLRENWLTFRQGEMYDVVLAKFTQHPDLATRLIATGESLLIEGNWWHDNYWGICHCDACMVKSSPGFNGLGKIHMAIRRRLTK